MPESPPPGPEFLLASCLMCGRDVLTHVIDLDEHGREVRCCIHCDGAVSGNWKTVAASELAGHGYVLDDAADCIHGDGCGMCCGVRLRKR